MAQRLYFMRPIEEMDLYEMVAKAQTNLNDAYKDYKTAPSVPAKEFAEIKLQVCIFQYDVCVELTTLIRNQLIGFAVCVALKGLVLRLFEFDILLRQTLLPKLLNLAKAREIQVEGDCIQQLKREWKVELQLLQGWHHVRNHAAGHYGRDLHKQFEVLESLSFDEVMDVAGGFLQFAQSLFKILRDTGRGVVSKARH